MDAGDDELVCKVAVDPLAFDWSWGCAIGGTMEGSVLVLVGLFPLTGLQEPELSSGQRNTSIGPCVLFKDISKP